MSCPRRRGFTIPEMLAVVAITIILLSMLLPALKNAKEPALAAVCENNLRQLIFASHNYGVENLGYLPFPNWGGWGKDLGDSINNWKDGGWLYSNPQNETWSSNSDWTPELIDTGVIYPYTQDRQIYRCPKDKPPFPILSGQITNYNMNGSVCGYGEARTFRKSQFDGGDFIIWEVDPKITSTGWWWDGANFPGEGIGTDWHQLGGTLVAIDGHCEWMQWREFDAERSKPGKNRLWNAPNTTNGH